MTAARGALTPSMVAAAAAIANARGGRRGVPEIINVLDLLPTKLRDEVLEDARAALEAAGVPELVDTCLAVSDPIGYCDRTGQDVHEPNWLANKLRAAIAGCLR